MNWRRTLRLLKALGCCAVLLGSIVACATHRPAATSRPAPAAETRPVPHDGDAADDPAIWVHPERPELSLLLGTDKQGALHVYNLDGTGRTVLGRGSLPNNVDVIHGARQGTTRADLVVASTRAKNARGIKVWTINPATLEFREVTRGAALPVFGGEEPYGCCGFRNPRTGEANVFVTSKDGAVEQYVLRRSRDGRITAERVDRLKFESTIEACVVDEQIGFAYFGEESRGIWKLSTEPGRQRKPVLIARVGENDLTADVEGLAIYHGPGESGYLLASSQGNNTFKVYARGGKNEFIATIDPVAGQHGDVEETDGIAVTSANLGPLFPKGIFIAQDGKNGALNQNFKLYRWEDVAGTNLMVTTGWRPRR